jgi:large subunit ribosomal protein L21
MYAIVRIGGRQYPVEEGRFIVVEKLPYEVGEKIDLDEVLFVSDEKKPKVGKPLVSGATVKAEVISQFKGKKVIVFKYRPSTRYRRKQGHRQNYTKLMINEIQVGKKKSSPKEETEKVEEAETGE